MFKFVKNAIQACQFKRPKETTLSPDSPGFWEDVLKKADETKARLEQEWQQEFADALAAAAAGEGPQPWDRDWIEFQVDVEEDIRETAGRLGWHKTQDFLEIMEWAVASPQGQRALAQMGEVDAPGQHVLELIGEVARALTEASHQMLQSQGNRLGYTGDLQSDLVERRVELSRPLYSSSAWSES